MIERLVSAAVYLAVPLIGIVFFDWDWRSIIVLYWLQNVTAGVRTLIDMIRTRTPIPENSSVSFTINDRPVSGNAKKPFFVVFFMLHYGIFTTVHGVFVFLIALGMFDGLFRSVAGHGAAATLGSLNINGIIYVWVVGSIAQVVLGFMTPRDALPHVGKLFFSPYARIFVLHVTVLGGVWLIIYFGWPPAAAVLLVALQFVVDLWKPLGATSRAKVTQTV